MTLRITGRLKNFAKLIYRSVLCVRYFFFTNYNHSYDIVAVFEYRELSQYTVIFFFTLLTYIWHLNTGGRYSIARGDIAPL